MNGGGMNAVQRGRWARQLAGARGIRGVANRIERLGNGLFDVAELEGYQGVSQISGGHSANSSHYDGTGFDVNTTRNNNTPFEKQKLRRLARVIQKLYGLRLDQVISPEANASGSGWHGHFDFTSRKWGRTGRNSARPKGAPTGPQRG